MLEVRRMKTDHQTDPAGVSGMPQFGWEITSDRRNVVQKTYRLQIAGDRAFENVLYDSGTVESRESVSVRPEGDFLRGAEKYYARVQISDGTETSAWSGPSCFITALEEGEWKAPFVSAENDDAYKECSKGTYVRGTFRVKGMVREAYAYTTALGLYNFFLNGEKVGEDEMTPGWTSYRKNLLYQTYDVTELLHEGENAAGAMLAAGWYKGVMGLTKARNNYGDQTAFAMQLVIRYEDGSEETVCTGGDWSGCDSPVVFSEIYDGETYDARLEIPGWAEAETPEGDWHSVKEVPFDKAVLHAQAGARVRMTDRMPAERIFTTPKGETVIDFGQNMTGRIHVTAKGKPGDVIELRCFEVLDHDGNVYFDNLRHAKTTMKYIFAEEKEVTWYPRFTYMGFRYAKIISFPGKPEKEDFTAYTLHSEMERTGDIQTSDPLLNQLHHNILWGMKGNFLDVPTDCPQRDERLGWTADAQIFSRTASYLMDTDLFYRKWLCDVAAEQTEEGGIPHVVPDVWTGKNVKGKIFENGTHSAAGWADAAVIIPWTLYLMYGDTSVIVKQYESMKAWIDFMTAHARDCMWEYRMQFGDWVALDAEEGSYYGATPLELTNMAYYAYSTGLFAEMARVVGKDSDAKAYRTLYEKIRSAYQERYFTEDGHLTVRTQTAHILTLYFDLVIQEYRENVVSDLLRLLKKENGHLVTGFMGTPHFCQVLSDNDHAKEAYELLLKDDFPSWLYQVKQGATTVWEHWDGMKPDGSMWSPAMNSFNHYAYGAVGDWLYRAVAGISCNRCGAGFTEIQLAPCIGTYLDYAGVVYESVHGRIVSRWERKENEVNYHFEIPCNTTAKVHLYQVEKVEWADGLLFAACGEKGAPAQIAEAGSGSYTVRYRIC